ncbi:MAG: hypothetical protein JJ863_05720 [Deltaproteobacteria bacterium]|nr:hypothetical protein [Deltaproteobacteria bacterium]
MGRFFILFGVLLVTYLGFFLFPTPNDGQSAEQVAGMPVVCVGAAEEEPCWLTIGAGQGVVLVGMGGAGVVCFALYSVGLLFATGQLAAGGLAIGQVGFGGSFFLGQAGVGPVALGQLVGGALVAGQGALGASGGDFLKELSAELNQILGKGGEPPPPKV